MRNFDDSLALKAQQSFRDSINAAGVCSFGENPRSILAWSHYADSHRGVCLQFEVASSLAIFGQALPVNYSEEYPTLNWVNQSEKIVEVLLTKYIGWKYEEESRIIIQESAGQFIDFQPAALSGIIIGCSASEETVAQLNELIHERISRGFPAPRLYRAFANDGKYRLLHKKRKPSAWIERMTPIEQDVLTLKNNIGSVDQLADLDRGLLDHTIQQLKERDARLEAAGVDNPRLCRASTAKPLISWMTRPESSPVKP